MDLENLKLAKMEIKVLGTGCAKCKSLEKVTREAVKKAGVDATITKVEDIVEIMQFGVMTTPAVVVNGQVVVKGKVPSVDELTKLLSK
ncbi:small redox-active disulfide protein 2 [Saccharicrinis carchari]|uniref:Small redox-active disulfide protein 2 n=2 Tax=Saccharicrinis carchari TaxID=1168039 RepID=A0A521D6Z2_SACCC|nr:small redox-active disulfide protein 2 [Saccharicrinis carchari]